MQQGNGMDKKQLISFAIFSAIALGSMFYFQNKQVKDRKEAAKTEQVVETTTTKVSPLTQNSETAVAEEKIKLKNEKLTVELSTKGGQITSVQLNEYNAFDKNKEGNKPLYLFDGNNASYGFQFKDKSGKVFSTKDIAFVPKIEGNRILMQGGVGTAVIQFVYTLKPDNGIDFSVKTQGLSQLVSDGKAEFVWDYSILQNEKGRDQEQSHTEFVYTLNNYKDYDYDAKGELNEEEETLNWIGVKQQFFTALIEAKNGFKHSFGKQEPIETGKYVKKFNYKGQVSLTNNELVQEFTWYFLPLDLPLLKSYDKNFDEIIPYGWGFIGWLNKYFFIPLYELLLSFGLAAGWAIFWLTIATKIVLSPIMYKQHKLSAMMRVIRPEIDEVNEKFKNADPMKKQQATMDVYRKAGVNQFAGCIPAILQIPIFYALFRFFPNMIDLRGKSFWFAQDLTAYDDIIKLPYNIPLIGDHISILAIMCTVVVLIYTLMTSGNQPQQEGMPNMKVLMFIFPIFFFFFLNTAASGLSWYYFVSNAINIVIVLMIKNLILDDKKIHAQILANKEKPKQEGRFQRRMREMMEKAQEQQSTQQKQNKSKRK